MKIKIKTPIPGPKSGHIFRQLQKVNGAVGAAYPYVHAKVGDGAYFKDLDGNIFLDFASQIATNPLGYNHPAIKKVIQRYAKLAPVKYAGQDFLVKEHLELIETLLSTTPKEMNAAFLINSGAEAAENAIKIAMRNQPQAKVGISFTSAFHGRTLGALSLTNSYVEQKKHYFTLPIKHLSFSEQAPIELRRILEEAHSGKEIGFVILEHVQGEGGYNVPSQHMVQEVFRICKQHKIPYIADEVQAGMGRTGKWWAWEHFDCKPTVMACAKALQVGATVANKQFFPQEAGAISSTWGGGHTLDLAVGATIIQTIKKDHLLTKNKVNGKYIEKQLKELEERTHHVWNSRGMGLMRAFDLPTAKIRDDVVTECLKKGLVILGCGKKGIRLIPPYIIKEKEIDEAMRILEKAIEKCSVRGFKHKGHVCNFVGC